MVFSRAAQNFEYRGLAIGDVFANSFLSVTNARTASLE
jgi:hypothetical protein